MGYLFLIDLCPDICSRSSSPYKFINCSILFVWEYFSMTLCWSMPLFWFQKGKKHDADDFISDGSSDERPRKKRRGSDAENEDGEGRKKKKRRFVFPVHRKIFFWLWIGILKHWNNSMIQSQKIYINFSVIYLWIFQKFCIISLLHVFSCLHDFLYYMWLLI